MKNKNKQFNTVLSGVGGQGLITLGKIISQAAFFEGEEVKMSELHGLSQRGGSVAVQVRFGKNIYSPLVAQAQADLVLSLERNESLKNCYFASKNKTIFLINDFSIFSPSFGNNKLPSLEKILEDIKLFTKKTYTIKASETTREKLGTEIVSGVYMLSGAIFKGLIPIKPANLLKAIKVVLGKNFDINKKAFDLAKKSFNI
ncbi:MAG: indolepyruvate oxidoreductase subunit beta [Patescibacteria group bacterium]|nr:indolepyruvate oxidoreductase subunit beta [Patescibacteria group bacterium]